MMLEIFKQAILDKRCLTGRHKDTERHFAPHAIGFKSDGTPAAFVFQYAGRTTSRLPPHGARLRMAEQRAEGTRDGRIRPPCGRLRR